MVPDPRKRADLFEIARHSWLSDYHHVVAHITSSITSIDDIVNPPASTGKLGQDASRNTSDTFIEAPEAIIPIRSASVREPRTTAPTTRDARAQHGAPPSAYDASAPERANRATRHTLQPEYVEPTAHTARGEAVTAAPVTTSARTRVDQRNLSASSNESAKPLPRLPMTGSPAVNQSSTAQRKMSPPTRPPRDIPRSISDSTGAFGIPAPVTYTTRPSTGASMTSANGAPGTRSDMRLPSRGSYGQPVPPTVATTSAQGSVTQPKPGHRYNISGPMPQQGTHAFMGQPTIQQPSNQSNDTMPPPVTAKGHHRRTSTLDTLKEKLLGRTGSVRKRESDQARQRNGRKYPPTSMKQPMGNDGPRASVESKRSFSFGLGRKKSSDLESQQEPTGRRFSLLPKSMSIKGLMGKDQGEESPQVNDFPQPPQHRTNVEKPERYNGQQDQPRPRVANFSRPPQAQQYRDYPQTTMPPSNDVYGGTGMYMPEQYSEPPYQQPDQPYYPDGFNDQARPSMQQQRPHKGVLTKPNRKFTDAYDQDHATGTSAVKRVSDFFRRRRVRESGY